MSSEKIDKENIPIPSKKQMEWLDAEFGMFFHFGINTFSNREWTDGTREPKLFKPTHFNPNKWIEIAKEAGAKYVILTTKHHDGFCLWQTKTTDYSVKSSPWRNGKGDVVKEFINACRSHGMRFGFYLSPWDRHEPCYSDSKAYDEYYIAQLTELLRDYAEYDEVFEIWFDGAGSEGHVYNWEKIIEVCKKYQPSAMIFGMGGATVRWAGNERGFAPYPNWNSAIKTDKGKYSFDFKMTEGFGNYFIPAECDVPIRLHNWFYHSGLWGFLARRFLLSVDKLVEIYEKSIGRGANLLLNLAPTKRGLLDPVDVKRLKAFIAKIKKIYDNPIATNEDAKINWLKVNEINILELQWNEEIEFDRVVIQEDIQKGQVVKEYSISIRSPQGNWIYIESIDPMLTIGAKKIDILKSMVKSRELRISFNKTLAEPKIRSVKLFNSNKTS